MTSIQAVPPSPRRCLRILQAHHLHCQALTQGQIAERMACARPTVSAYLRDFQLHRDHILHTVAGDQLLDQVYLLAQPEADSDPARHRRRVAAARELRLLLRDLPQLEQHEQERRDQLEAARNAPAIALARSRHYLAGLDGHLRYVGGAEIDECMPECPRCFPELYEGDDAQPPVVNPFAIRAQPTKPDFTEPELTSPDDSCPESDTTEQNLTKSDTLETEFPAHNGEFADQHPDTDEFSPPPRGVEPQSPVKRKARRTRYLDSKPITVHYRL